MRLSNLFRGRPTCRVYLVRCMWEGVWPPRSFGWKDERVVTDSPERALAMVEHYRTTKPAPLMFVARVIEDLGPYPGGAPTDPYASPPIAAPEAKPAPKAPPDSSAPPEVAAAEPKP